MKKVIALILSFSCASASAEWYQPPIYRHPGGKFNMSPPAPSSPGKMAPWDGGIEIGRQAPPSQSHPGFVSPKSRLSPPPNSSGSRGQKNDSPARTGGVPPGTGIEFDIAGMADLARRIEAEKAYKEYLNWLNSVSTRIKQFYKEQVKTAGELRKKGYTSQKSKPVMAQDNAQLDEFEESGAGLVVLAPMNRAKVIEMMREFNIDVSTGSNQEADIFLDAYERFQAQEEAYFQEVLQNGADSTKRMRDESDGQLKKMNKEVEQLVQVNSEFARPEEIQPPQRIPPEFQSRVDRVEQKIDRIDTASPQGVEFKAFARNALEQGVAAMTGGSLEDAKWYLSVAEGVTDMALGLDPVTGFYRSVVEASTGYNMVTMEKLSGIERSFAVLGVFSGGLSTPAVKTMDILAKIGAKSQRAERMIQAIQRSGQSVARVGGELGAFLNKARAEFHGAEKTRVLSDLSRSITKTLERGKFEVNQILSSEQLNLAYFKGLREDQRATNFLPFQHAKFGADISAKGEQRALRFHSLDKAVPNVKGSYPAGGFVALEEDVADILKSGKPIDEIALDIQNRFSLPYTPKWVTDVHIPDGQGLLTSGVRANFGGAEGARQYLLKGELPPDHFRNTRPISEIVKDAKK